MKISLKNKFFFLIALISIFACLLYVIAADHSEAPGPKADPAADIADLYAWHEGNKLTAILTYAGLQSTITDQTATYDPDVLYTVHIDNNADNEVDINIYARFGQNNQGKWGIQVQNLPGSSGDITGEVETTIDAGNGNKVFAGLFDDPFFFDLEGFNDTLATGTLMFDNARDSVAGFNVSAIVLEMDLAIASGGSDDLSLWASTGRE